MSLLHLHIAYIATWVIHGVYLTFLGVKNARLNKEIEKLEKKSEVGSTK